MDSASSGSVQMFLLLSLSLCVCLCFPFSLFLSLLLNHLRRQRQLKTSECFNADERHLSRTNKEHLASNNSHRHICTLLLHPCSNNWRGKQISLVTRQNSTIKDVYVLPSVWEEQQHRTVWLAFQSIFGYIVIFSVHTTSCPLLQSVVYASWYCHVILLMCGEGLRVPRLCSVRPRMTGGI